MVLAATGCSSQLPPEATAAWDGPSPQESDPRRWALSYAILAPHSHNLQSWLVDLRQPGEILLSCDLQRVLPQTDPLGRQIMMSHGTFLELLDIAARERGQRTEITLFPQGPFGPDKLDSRPVARIRMRPDASVKRDPLFAQIRRRHTNREPYDLRLPAPGAVQAILVIQCAGNPVRAGFTARVHVELQRHRLVAAEAWRIELVTPRTILESYRWLRIGPQEIALHRDGISINQPLVRVIDAAGLFDRAKAPGPDDRVTRQQIEDFDALVHATPAFFWLVTQGNDRATQVNAGRAYVRAQLAAAAYYLSMHPLSQALQEYPEMAKPYAAIHALLQAPQPAQTVQMWTRLGYGPPVEPAPRRGLEAFEPIHHCVTQASCSSEPLQCVAHACRANGRPIAVEAVHFAAEPAVHMEAEPDRADRLVGAAARGPGHARHRDAHLRLRMPHGAESHGARDHFADGTVLCDQRFVHAQQFGLGGVRIGHEAALEPVAGAAQVGAGGSDQAAGAALGAGQHLAARQQGLCKLLT